MVVYVFKEYAYKHCQNITQNFSIYNQNINQSNRHQIHSSFVVSKKVELNRDEHYRIFCYFKQHLYQVKNGFTYFISLTLEEKKKRKNVYYSGYVSLRFSCNLLIKSNFLLFVNL